MIFSVIVLCTIDRAIIRICANTAWIWQTWFDINYFVSSHMLLLSRLSRQDIVLCKITYIVKLNRKFDFGNNRHCYFENLLKFPFC